MHRNLNAAKASVNTRMRGVIVMREYRTAWKPESIPSGQCDGLLSFSFPGSPAGNLCIPRAHRAPTANSLWIGQILARVAEMTRTRGLLAFDCRQPRLHRHLLQAPSPGRALLIAFTAPGILIRSAIAKMEAPAYLLWRRLHHPSILE
jgi:hypothetical protein